MSKKCEKRSSESQVIELLSQDREQYAAKWEASSRLFDREGHYDWMASFLHKYPFVLEVGTGTGRGTLALLRAGHLVVSIDENPACLQKAETTIRESGGEVKMILREGINAASGHYQLGFRKISTELPTSGALLIQGDIFAAPPGHGRFSSIDPHLEDWLSSVGPFDAVVCWLIGTHNARDGNIAIQCVDQLDYRLKTQHYTYALADKILRPGGMLHVVDRTKLTDDEIAQKDIVSMHRTQASSTTLVIQKEIRQRPYRDAEDGIEMVGYQANISAMGFTSVCLIKPGLETPK